MRCRDVSLQDIEGEDIDTFPDTERRLKEEGRPEWESRSPLAWPLRSVLFIGYQVPEEAHQRGRLL